MGEIIFILLLLERGSHCVALVGLELMILLL
jgi:hypothetical protein